MTQTVASDTPVSAAPHVTTGAPTPAPGLGARIFGVITSPRATYADVVAHPHWLGVLAVVIVLGAGCTYVFLSTEVGQQAMLDQQLRFMESFGMKVSDAAYARMQAGLDRAKYTGPIGQAVLLPIAGLIISAIAFAVFNAILGADAKFKQAFAVVAHSGVIVSVAQIFGMPIAYARETMSSTTNLGVFVAFLDESSFAARFLGSIDLFHIWWLVSLAIGFGVLYRRRTAPIATTMIAIYAAIALVFAAVRTALSGA